MKKHACYHSHLFVIALLFLVSCEKEKKGARHTDSTPAKTEHIVLIVVDGPRYSETWGYPDKSYIPFRATELASQGTLCTHMYNDGATFTTAGHTALTRGRYEEMLNDGSQVPEAPSFFQYWLQGSQQPAEKAWIVASKDKLEVLADCKDVQWKGKFKPMTDCGKSGLNSGYRDDSTTFAHALNVFKQYHPSVVLINFKEPDVSGHANNWNGYLKGISTTDYYCYQIWDFLQQDPYYKGKTSLFITNDHGRHPGDFTSHGDKCDGCRHIEFLALGPEFRTNYIDTVRHSQVDIAATAASLLGLDMPGMAGKELVEIYKD
jgi:hypothetical protein